MPPKKKWRRRPTEKVLEQQDSSKDDKKTTGKSLTEEEYTDQLVDIILDTFPSLLIDEWKEQNKYIKYQNDPIAFGREILGEEYPEDIQNLLKSVAENRVTIAQSCTGPGKSFSSASIAIWFHICFPNSQVWTCAAPPEDNLKKILWAEIGKKVTKCSELFSNHKIGSLHIARNEWSFITGVLIPQSGTEQSRESKFSGKHSEHILFIVDEGDAVPDEVYRGIDGCLSGGVGRLLIMFNPKQESGAAYRMIMDHKANVVKLSAFRHPNVMTGKNIFPGAVSREATIKRINEWTIPIKKDEEPDSACFEVPDFLIGESTVSDKGDEFPPLNVGYRRIIDPQFYYKVLGVYPIHGSNQLISREWVNKARNRWNLYVAQFGETPPQDIRPIMGLDVADIGDDWNVAVFRYGGFVSRFDKWRGVNPGETTQIAAEMAKELSTLEVKVDSIGVGADVAPGMRRLGVRASRVSASLKPTKMPIGKEKCVFFGLRDQLCWEVREWLRTDDTAMLPPDDQLIEELVVLTYEEKNGKIKVISKDKIRSLLKRSPNTFDSLALTFAPEERPPKIAVL